MILIKQKNRLRAFTLIELLVVVAIIGVLATVVMLNVSGAKASSRYAKTLAEMSEMAKAVNLYKVQNNGVYPEGWYSAGGTPGVGDFEDYSLNNTLTGAGANIFLVDYMGGKIPKPDCAGGHYAFYRPLVPGGGYVTISYFSPMNPSNVTAKFHLDSGTDMEIRDKTTKSITCKETNLNFMN